MLCPKNYIVAYLILMLLLASTFGVHYLPLGHYSLPIALFIGSCKAVVIIYIFMELKIQKPIVVFMAMLGFIWLAIFAFLIFSDYFIRLPLLILS